MPQAEISQPATIVERISSSNPEYGEVVDFLIDQAWMLDEDRYEDWLDTTTEDVSYILPSRSLLDRDKGKGFDDRTTWYADGRELLAMRVKRATTLRWAWDRNPAPRTRRMVSNVVVHAAQDNELSVKSALLVLWSRFDGTSQEMLSVSREDILRKTSNGLRMASRRVLTDTATFDSRFINVIF